MRLWSTTRPQPTIAAVVVQIPPRTVPCSETRHSHGTYHCRLAGVETWQPPPDLLCETGLWMLKAMGPLHALSVNGWRSTLAHSGSHDCHRGAETDASLRIREQGVSRVHHHTLAERALRILGARKPMMSGAIRDGADKEVVVDQRAGSMITASPLACGGHDTETFRVVGAVARMSARGGRTQSRDLEVASPPSRSGVVFPLAQDLVHGDDPRIGYRGVTFERVARQQSWHACAEF